MKKNDLDAMKVRLTKEFAELHLLRDRIDERIADLDSRLQAIEVLSRPNTVAPVDDAERAMMSAPAGETLNALQIDDDPNGEYIGGKILDWAASYLQVNGPTKVRDLYVVMPRELKMRFETSKSNQSPLFRLRRLFRRKDTFTVRRSDGLVELTAPTTDATEFILLSARVTRDGLSYGFVTLGEDGQVLSFNELRRQIANGVSFYVRGPEGRYSTVLARGPVFRSADDDGTMNDDLASLPVYEFREVTR